MTARQKHSGMTARQKHSGMTAPYLSFPHAPGGNPALRHSTRLVAPARSLDPRFAWCCRCARSSACWKHDQAAPSAALQSSAAALWSARLRIALDGPRPCRRGSACSARDNARRFSAGRWFQVLFAGPRYARRITATPMPPSSKLSSSRP
jgi:hypothetical protein